VGDETHEFVDVAVDEALRRGYSEIRLYTRVQPLRCCFQRRI